MTRNESHSGAENGPPKADKLFDQNKQNGPPKADKLFDQNKQNGPAKLDGEFQNEVQHPRLDMISGRLEKPEECCSGNISSFEL